MCIGHMQILWLLYLRDLSIHRVWYLWGSWNQYPMDTEAQWYGFGRYKDEEGMVKSKRKKNSVYWHNWNLISDHCHLPPVLGSKMSAKKCRGWLYTIKKKRVTYIFHVFLPHSFPFKLWIIVCAEAGSMWDPRSWFGWGQWAHSGEN